MTARNSVVGHVVREGLAHAVGLVAGVTVEDARAAVAVGERVAGGVEVAAKVLRRVRAPREVPRVEAPREVEASRHAIVVVAELVEDDGARGVPARVEVEREAPRLGSVTAAPRSRWR